MTTLLDDLSLAQQDDIIRMLDGGKPVGDDQHSADILHLLQRILNEDLGLGVDIGGGFVQDHDGRLMQDGTGEAEQLPLTGGEVIAPLPDRLVQTLFQLADKGVGVDVLTGLPDFFVGNIFLAQHDIQMTA